MDGVPETVKHEIKKQEGGLLEVQPIISSIVKLEVEKELEEQEEDISIKVFSSVPSFKYYQDY